MWKITRYGKSTSGAFRAETITYLDGARADAAYQEDPEEVAAAYGVDVPEGTPETVYLANVSEGWHDLGGERPTTGGMVAAPPRPGWAKASLAEWNAYLARGEAAEQAIRDEQVARATEQANWTPAERLARIAGISVDDLRGLVLSGPDDKGPGHKHGQQSNGGK